jgi:hypothetical protein
MRKFACILSVFFGMALGAFAQGGPAGIFYAADFGRWQLPQGNSPTSGMIQWPSANICSVTSGGYTFTAVKVGRPLKIVDVNPLNTEIVIPSAVTINGGSCSVTALMLYTHTAYTVESGTAGLQEAIDYGTVGSRTAQVILTPGWSLLGGTTGMITSATGSANVSILDQRVSTLVPYVWSGSAYSASGFQTGAGGTAFQVQFNNNGALGGWTQPQAFANIVGPGGTISGSISACVTNNVVNPTCPTYGADPSGVLDSTVAIQNALNNANGYAVHLPAGTYKVNLATLVVPAAGQSFYGDGLLTLIQSGMCSTTINTASYIIQSANGRQTVHDMALQGTGGPACLLSGVEADNTHSGRQIYNMQVSKVYGRGIAVFGTSDSAHDNTVSDCWFCLDGGGSQHSSIYNNKVYGGWKADGAIGPWTSSGDFGLLTATGSGYTTTVVVPSVVSGSCTAPGNLRITGVSGSALSAVSWGQPGICTSGTVLSVPGGTGGQLTVQTNGTFTISTAGSGYSITGVTPTVVSGSCVTTGVLELVASAGVITQQLWDSQPTGCSAGTILALPGGTGGQVEITSTSGSTFWDCIIGEGANAITVSGNSVVTDCGQSGVYAGGNNDNLLTATVTGNTVTYARNYGVDLGVSTTGNLVSNATVTGNTALDAQSGSCNFAGWDHSTATGNTCQESSNYLTYWGIDSKAPGTDMGGVRSALSTVPMAGNTISGNNFLITDAPYHWNVFQLATGTNNALRSLNHFTGSLNILNGATFAQDSGLVANSVTTSKFTDPTLMGSKATESYPLLNTDSVGRWQEMFLWTGYQPNGSYGDSVVFIINSGGYTTGTSNAPWSELVTVRMGSGTLANIAPDITGITLTAFQGIPDPSFQVVAVDHACSGSVSQNTWEIWAFFPADSSGNYTILSQSPLSNVVPVGQMSSTAATSLCSAGTGGTAANVFSAGLANGPVATWYQQNTFKAGVPQRFQTPASGAAVQILDSGGALQGEIGTNGSSGSTPEIRFSGGNIQINGAGTGKFVKMGNDSQTFLLFNWGTSSTVQWTDGTHTEQLNPPGTLTNATWTLPSCATGCTLATGLSVSWTPTAATASSCVEQTVTITGLVTGRAVSVSPPASLGSHIWAGSARVSASNTLAVSFCADATGGTPPSGTWTVLQ